MKLSIVIPTYRRGKLLERCLQPLLKSRAENVEIILSDDAHETAVQELAKFHQIKYVAGPQRGPAANRNAGASAANGEWLGFIDDDCIPSATWIQEALREIDSQNDVVEGKTICPDQADTPFIEIVENLNGGVYWSCNLVVRSSTFHELGRFDETFEEAGGEDMEFAWRIIQRGVRTHFASALEVLHPPRRINLLGLWKRSLMIRWLSLYQIKTKEVTGVPGLLWLRTLNLARVSYRRLRSLSVRSWRRAVFQAVWDLLTYPILIPYIIYWHVKFRRQTYL